MLTCNWDWVTLVVRVSSEALHTTTDRIVIDNIAFGILATGTGTWINAFAIIAGSIECALRIHYTFRSTLRWRARVFRQT